MERLVRVLDRVWNFDLLAPMIRILRGAVTAIAILAALVVLVLAARADGALSAAIFIGGMLGIALVYVAVMLTPETCALILRAERSSRPGEPRAAEVRYRGLLWYAALLRWGVLFTVAGYLLRAFQAALMKLRDSWGWLRRASMFGSEPLFSAWALLQIATIALILYGAYRLWRRNVSGTGTPRPLTMLAALFAIHSASVLFSACIAYLRAPERTYGYYEQPVVKSFSLFFYSPAVVAFWVVAGVIAARGLVKAQWSDGRRFVALVAAAIGLWVVVTKGALLFWLPEAFRNAFASLRPGNARVEEILHDTLSRVAPAALKFLWPILLVLVAIACAIAWMKSDAARALERLERNLRPDDATTVAPSLHVAVASIAGWIIAAAIVFATVTLFFVRNSITDAVKSLPSNLQLLAGDFLYTRNEWLALNALVGVFALVGLIRLTFDLASHTRSNRSGPALEFFSLRILVALQTLLSAIVTIGAAWLAWGVLSKIGRSLDSRGLAFFVQLGAVVVAAVAYVSLTLVSSVIRNCIELEANTRGSDSSVVRTATAYPALSFVATFGKGAVILVTVILSIAGLWLASREPASLVLTAPLVFALYVVLSAFPDLAALLLTIDRNLAGGVKTVGLTSTNAVALPAT